MTDTPAERAASKTRTRILACGRRIVARSGLRGLTVRGVAAQAKVNLGTFVYHFGTREQFVAELMESWYAPIYAQLLTLSVDEQSPPLQRIRRFLLQLAAFMAQNRGFVRHTMIDAMGDELAAVRFVKSLLERHPLLLFRLIREAQQAGDLPPGDPMKMGIFLFGATLFPSIWMGVLLPESVVSGDAPPLVRASLFEPAEIEQRLEWALRGLAAHRQVKTSKTIKAKQCK
jgi:TetR/AcrR family transcriptional regulator, transcriptional repressor for nem operon